MGGGVKLNNMLQRFWIIGAIFCLGLFARAFEFGTLPPSLNQDEASIGYEAFSLLHFGKDHNGFSYPVHFVAWGGGQSVLYAYLAMPFVAAGLTPLNVRLPMLICGLLSIPLIYIVARRAFGETEGRVATLLLAISPWHVMLSRWALDANLLPFFFLLGYACLLKSLEKEAWFIPACVFFALSLYCYDVAFVAVPLFILLATLIVLRAKRLGLKTAFAGASLFILLSIPIALYVAVNSLQLATITLGVVSIPRLPAVPRYESLSIFFRQNQWQRLWHNFKVLGKILLLQTDGLPWNMMVRYGYLYKVTFPLAVGGIFWMVGAFIKQKARPENLLLLLWIGVSLVIGVIQQANVNRINLMFMPLILCVAFCLVKVNERLQGTLPVAVCLLLIGFFFFFRDYRTEQRAILNVEFYNGILPAMKVASQSPDTPVCVTNRIRMPYIYALFVEQTNPDDFQRSVVYSDPTAPFRRAISFGRYTFGLKYCAQKPGQIFIISNKEPRPVTAAGFQVRKFDNFLVYLP